jgi:hypothetical protein
MFGMDSWKSFIDGATEIGFEIVVRRRFACQGEQPEFVIMAHREKKLLIAATSYPLINNKEAVNGGRLYGTVFLGDDADWRRHDVLCYCDHATAKDGKVAIEFDVRRGLGTIASIEADGGKFVSWGDPSRFLWLLDFVEERQSSTDHGLWERRRDEFLATAPAWVKEFIANP